MTTEVENRLYGAEVEICHLHLIIADLHARVERYESALLMARAVIQEAIK
jgi:hypothetical protein